jgi:hypothetical protein
MASCRESDSGRIKMPTDIGNQRLRDVMSKNLPNYWDVTIFIPPDVVKKLPADCGDTYDTKLRDETAQGDRDFRRYWVEGLLGMFYEYKDKGLGAWGAKSTKHTMSEILEKGVTISINQRGQLRAFVGDVMLESHCHGDPQNKAVDCKDWVLRNRNTGLYWSNEWGWGSLEGCQHYENTGGIIDLESEYIPFDKAVIEPED